MPDRGQPDLDGFARAVTEVSERVSVIVREEIELAKAEMSQKAKKLARGAAVGAIAGVFALVGLFYLLDTVAWLLTKVLNDQLAIWVGFLVTALLLFILAGVLGYLAFRWIGGASPPAPTMAIDEAKLVAETLTSSEPGRTV